MQATDDTDRFVRVSHLLLGRRSAIKANLLPNQLTPAIAALQAPKLRAKQAMLAATKAYQDARKQYEVCLLLEEQIAERMPSKEKLPPSHSSVSPPVSSKTVANVLQELNLDVSAKQFEKLVAALKRK